MSSRTSPTEPRTPEERVRDLLGKDYADRGRGPRFYDCFGLYLETARRLGVDLKDPFTPSSVDRRAYRAFYMHFFRIPNGDVGKPLDILFFDRRGRQHVMTVLSPDYVLDTSKTTGAHLVALSDAARAPHKAYRLKCRRESSHTLTS